MFRLYCASASTRSVHEATKQLLLFFLKCLPFGGLYLIRMFRWMDLESKDIIVKAVVAVVVRIRVGIVIAATSVGIIIVGIHLG